MSTPAIHTNVSVRPVGSSGAAAAPPSTSTPILPQPDANPNVTDALELLTKLTADMNATAAASGKSQAKMAMQSEDAARIMKAAALERAKEAAEQAKKHADDGGVFAFVTNHIGVVGLVGLCTGQYYLVAEDIIAHELQPKNTQTSVLGAVAAYAGPVACAVELALEKGLPEDSTKPLDAVSIDDQKVRLANKVALTIVMAELAAAAEVGSAGAATGPMYLALAGTAISTASQVAVETGAMKAVFKSDADNVAMGCEIAALACSVGGAAWNAYNIFKTAGSVADAAKAAKGAATMNVKGAVDGADTIYRGYVALERADDEHDADLANIEVKKQMQQLQMLESFVDGLLDDLKEGQKRAERSAKTLQATIQTSLQTSMIATTGKV
jgi:hypothetical protein